jgi:hypothetical protein
MEVVAHHLQLEAVRRAVQQEGDQFGRSSYNRYYYATFLRVRTMMSALDAKWSQLPHADYPVTLRGAVKKKLQEGRKKALKVGDHEIVAACARAISAASEIANLMEAASATRVVADYNPQIPITFLGNGRFSLNNINITEAHDWPVRADTWSSVIEKTWVQLGG